MAFFGHARRNNKCNLVDMHSRNDAGEKKMQYIDNIKMRTRASLEENVRRTEDRTARCESSCAAGAANIRTDATD